MTPSSMLSPIKASLNRVALVTGAAQGIGRAIAGRLARDGYDIALVDIPPASALLEDTHKEVEGYGRRAVSLFADVRQQNQIEAALANTVRQLGPRLFVSVANAGIVSIGPLIDASPEEVKNQIDTNLAGVINTHILAARQMVNQGFGGRIIGAGSITSYRPWEGVGVYSATKFGIRGFTEAAAKEWAKYDIRVNAYAPGVVATRMMATFEDMNPQDDPMAERAQDKIIRERVPLGRIQLPEDVAKLVSFLASEDGEYITGQTVKACGGASL